MSEHKKHASHERKRELHKKLEKAKIYKKKVQDIAHDLFVQYKNGRIGYYEYQNKLRDNFDNKSVKDWISHYDEHISIYKKHLRHHEKLFSREKKKSFVKLGLLGLGILLLISVFY